PTVTLLPEVLKDPKEEGPLDDFDVSGMPLRVGKYDKGASAEEKRVLLRAVRDLATDAAAIIPAGMEIDFIEAKGGSGNAVFGAMADYLDKQISKAVIGQTMTTDEGSSRAQSEVHDEVRLDIRKADAKQLGSTIQRDLIAIFHALNFGPGVVCPEVSWPVEDPEDIKTFTEAVARVVPLGQPVAQADVAKRMGLRIPDAGEALLVAPPAGGALGKQAASVNSHACPGCGTRHVAALDQTAEDDPLVAEALADWEIDMAPIVEPILRAAEKASSYEELEELLDKMQPDIAALTRRLQVLTMKARGDGNGGR
ncbi:MAG TPA: DUF935 family protein, partial [Paracoccus sp. (in: a-proteobacteria)]|nr:DUF935 family protein [Paracoccus sp. (in: a-proteobacteria)]